MRKRQQRIEAKPSPTQIEAKLLEGLNGEAISITPDYFENKKRALARRIAARHRGK